MEKLFERESYTEGKNNLEGKGSMKEEYDTTWKYAKWMMENALLGR